MSYIPLDTQQKLKSLRLDNDQDTIDDLEQHLEIKFRKADEYKQALTQIAEPIQFLQQEAEREGKTLDGLEAQRYANSATWLQGIAANSLKGLEGA